jgi:hypothetical protein
MSHQKRWGLSGKPACGPALAFRRITADEEALPAGIVGDSLAAAARQGTERVISATSMPMLAATPLR